MFFNLEIETWNMIFYLEIETWNMLFFFFEWRWGYWAIIFFMRLIILEAQLGWTLCTPQRMTLLTGKFVCLTVWFLFSGMCQYNEFLSYFAIKLIYTDNAFPLNSMKYWCKPVFFCQFTQFNCGEVECPGFEPRPYI